LFFGEPVQSGEELSPPSLVEGVVGHWSICASPFGSVFGAGEHESCVLAMAALRLREAVLLARLRSVGEVACE
jgi:hypothetical protein